jgi:hypothetical protein
MKLDLKPESWKNLFDSIRQSEIKSVGNFWAAVQRLEEQYDLIKNDNTEKLQEEICYIIGEWYLEWKNKLVDYKSQTHWLGKAKEELKEKICNFMELQK